ncbi:hypothetical protein SPPR111872_12240 [Sphingobacterium prati]
MQIFVRKVVLFFLNMLYMSVVAKVGINNFF